MRIQRFPERRRGAHARVASRAPRRAAAPALAFTILAAILSATYLPPAGLAANEFRAQESYSAGGAPSAIASGDVTGDGKPDLVVALGGDHQVVLLRNRGDATFCDSPLCTTAPRFDAPLSPRDLLLRDLNGDGKLDLVVVGGGSVGGEVQVSLGQGGGAFADPQTFDAGTNPFAVVAGKFDGDAHLDLAVANFVSDDVSVLYGNGDGTFQTPVNMAAGDGPRALAVGDFNRDGKPEDLAVVSINSRTLKIFVNNGNRTFRHNPSDTYTASNGSVFDVAAGDFNGDSHSDLVVTVGGGYRVYMNRANSTGTFLEKSIVAAGIPEGVAVADVVRDGKADLVISQGPGSELVVYRGKGDGTFTQEQTLNVPPINPNGESQPRQFVIDSMNADGYLDIATANEGSGNASVLRGQDPSTPPPGPPPANDIADNAQQLTGESGSISGTTRNATKQAGEPDHAGNRGGKSVWYRWVAPNSGALTVHTLEFSTYDTVLGVYRYSPLVNTRLLLNGANDDVIPRFFSASLVQTEVIAGQTYFFAVDGNAGESGDFKLNWLLKVPAPGIDTRRPRIFSVTPAVVAQQPPDARGTLEVVVKGNNFALDARLVINGGDFSVLSHEVSADSTTIIARVSVNAFKSYGATSVQVANPDGDKDFLSNVKYISVPWVGYAAAPAGQTTHIAPPPRLPKPGESISGSYTPGGQPGEIALTSHCGQLPGLSVVGTLNGACVYGVNVTGQTAESTVTTLLGLQQLIPPGATLVGLNGSNLVGLNGSNLVGLNGSNFIGFNGLPLTGSNLGILNPNGAGLIGNSHGNLIGNSHGNLIGNSHGNIFGTSSGGVIPVGGGNLIGNSHGNLTGKTGDGADAQEARVISPFLPASELGNGWQLVRSSGGAAPTINNTDDQGSVAFTLDSTSSPKLTDSQNFLFAVVIDPPVVELDATSLTVGEGAGRASVTVRRTGGLSAAVSALYSTASGTATDRKDFTPAFGFVHFAPGETEKTVDVLIADDVFNGEGTESFTFSLSAPAGALLGEKAAATVSITDNDAQAPTSNQIDDTGAFVRQHYLDFLNREPDAPGLAFWTGGINGCGADAGCRDVKRTDTSAAFFLSIEFQNTGYYAFRLYRSTYGAGGQGHPRGMPLRDEFLRDSHAVGAGVVVGQGQWQEQLALNKLLFAVSWVLRPEFRSLFPEEMDAAQFVDKLFQNAGVTPSAAERGAATEAYGVGDAEGRARALLSVAESGSVYNAQYNPAFVYMQYVGYLRRHPSEAPDADFTGFDFWLAKLNGFSQTGEDVRDPETAERRARRAEMVRSFIVSDEYRKRFGQ